MIENTHDANLFANRCFDFACDITTLRNKDLTHAFSIRYSRSKGAYLDSISDYSDDIIIMRHGDTPRNKTIGELSYWLQQHLTDKPFFATV